jgi:flagellar basal-body rod protein FlgF
MQSGLYVGLSGQLAFYRRLETIAHNVANASTAGFRAEEVKFESVLSRVPPNPAYFASRGETYLSRRNGEVVRTGDPLDVAVQGDAWLSIDVDGQQVYTRDGRMMMSPDGQLQTLNGYPVLDVGGAPIQLNPNGGTPQINHDGAITQNGQRVGVIGLFRIDETAKLTRAPNSGVIPDQAATPALDYSVVGVLQGFSERGNVNPVTEMVHLIEVQRSFEALTNMMDMEDTSLNTAIRELGPTA